MLHVSFLSISRWFEWTGASSQKKQYLGRLKAKVNLILSLSHASPSAAVDIIFLEYILVLIRDLELQTKLSCNGQKTLALILCYNSECSAQILFQ